MALRVGMILPLTFLRTKLEETELPTGQQPCEEPCFVRLPCGVSSPNARKNDARAMKPDNNLKHHHLFTFKPIDFPPPGCPFGSSFPLEIALCFEFEQN